ncbi:MAG: rhodanese-like domain-containing protein [Rhodomicrobium sp.]
MSVKAVTPATLKTWLDAGKAVVVDVREPREYEAEHIEGSTLVPLRSLHPDALPDHAGQKLVLLCRVGTRSLFGCHRIAEAISGDVYNLEGGIKAWMSAGLPVFRFERSSPNEEGVPLVAKVMRFVTRFS